MFFNCLFLEPKRLNGINTLATNVVVNDHKKSNVRISWSTWFWEMVYSSFCHAQDEVSKYKQKAAQKTNWSILSNRAKPSIQWFVKYCIFFVVFFLKVFFFFFFSDFWKIHLLWKLLVSANLFSCKKHLLNLFQNLITSRKIYSCMGLTWMCLEVLTEIYDLVEIIWRTSKLIR